LAGRQDRLHQIAAHTWLTPLFSTQTEIARCGALSS
jgi:hypothetical protein